MSPRLQSELLTVATKGPSPLRVVTAPAGFDRGAGTEYAAAGATSELVTYRLPILTVGVLRTQSGGKFQIAIADDAGGPWTDLGPVQDGFAPSPTFAAFGPFSTPLLAHAGERFVRFTVVGKNAASTGFAVSLDYLDVHPSTSACSIAQVACGNGHACAVAGGGVRCWGENDAGQLGDGTTQDAWRVPAVDALAGANAVAAGGRHTCALTMTGPPSTGRRPRPPT